MKPDLRRYLGKKQDFFRNQLRILLLFRRYSATDEHLFIFIQLPGIFFISLRENNHLHTPRHILHRQEGHGLVLFRILHGFPRNDASNRRLLTILKPCSPAFFIQKEFGSTRLRIFFQKRKILLQRMAADVDAQHLLFKRKLYLLRKLSDIGQRCFQCFLHLFRRIIEDRILSLHAFLRHTESIHDLQIHMQILLSGSAETVAGPRLDQVFNRPFIQTLSPLLHSGQKFFQIHKGASLFPFPDDRLYHRSSDILDGP